MRQPIFPRFLFASSFLMGAAVLSPAHAQALRDLQVAQQGQSVTMRFDFDQQPRSAGIETRGGDTLITVDGVRLAPTTLQTDSKAPFSRIAIAPASETSSALTLTGAGLSGTSVTVYRNALVVSGQIAAAPAPPPAPMTAPSAATQLASAKPAAKPPARASASASTPEGTQLADEKGAISLTPKPAVAKKPSAKPPAPSSSGAFDALHPTAATLAGATAQTCSSAANAIQLDEWDLEWLGTHALCLIDGGKVDDAKKAIERLAMMDPSDWRVSTGRGLIALNAKSIATARLEFASAARSAKDAALVSRLQEIVVKLGSDAPTASNDAHRVEVAAAH